MKGDKMDVVDVGEMPASYGISAATIVASLSKLSPGGKRRDPRGAGSTTSAPLCEGQQLLLLLPAGREGRAARSMPRERALVGQHWRRPGARTPASVCTCHPVCSSPREKVDLQEDHLKDPSPPLKKDTSAQLLRFLQKKKIAIGLLRRLAKKNP